MSELEKTQAAMIENQEKMIVALQSIITVLEGEVPVEE